MTSLEAVGSEWKDAWLRLRSSWQRSASVWNDAVRQQFEREVWIPLEQEVLETQREMERLKELVNRAARNVH